VRLRVCHHILFAFLLLVYVTDREIVAKEWLALIVKQQESYYFFFHFHLAMSIVFLNSPKQSDLFLHSLVDYLAPSLSYHL
jgi:hypothetical protein